MNYELQDWEMSFKDMFFSVLYKWKQILVIAVVIALALGGMQAFKTRESNIANKASYESKLASYERSLAVAQGNYDYANQKVENQKRYLQESTLMQIDAYNAYQARITFYISSDYQIMPEMTYQNEDISKSLVAIYKLCITDDNVIAQVSEELGMESKNLRELVSVSQPSDHVLSVVVSHSMDDIAKFADNVVIMNRGRVLMEGTPREVFVREDFIRQAGLDVPQITNIVKALKAGGMDIPSDIYTMDEAVDAIVRAMRGKNRAGGAEKC